MIRPLILSLALLPLAACGGGTDAAGLEDQAYNAMASGDSAQALELFDQLLAGMDASDPRMTELSVARCEALAGVDGKKAQEEFLALAEANDLTVKDYTGVAGNLQQAKNFEPAVLVLDAAKQKFPESEEKILALIDELGKKAAAAGDEGAASALQGLGYLGGD